MVKLNCSERCVHGMELFDKCCCRICLSPQTVPIKVNGNFLLHLQVMNKAQILYICFYNLLDILRYSAVFPTIVLCAYKFTDTHAIKT